MMTRLFLLAAVLLATVAPTAAADAPPAVRTLILVRHGHYDDARGDAGHLTSLGVAQAQLLGARLAASRPPIDHFYVSPLIRARETAASMAQDFPGQRFEVVDDLAECTPTTRVASIMAGEKPKNVAACEAQLQRVVARFFQPAKGKPETDLLVCHANVIRYLVMRALGADPTAWLTMSLHHASMTEFRIEADGRIRVIAVGDTGHIPPNLRTGAVTDPDRSLALPSP